MSSGKFEFHGNGLSYLWLLIWTNILLIITVGLAFPWTYAAIQRWISQNTTIDGKPLVFKGSGMGFFGNYLLIVFLTVITLGIYSPWGACRMLRWQTNNTYFADPGDNEVM